MKQLIRIAIRNVIRQKRRSLFAGLSIFTGIGFVIFLSGFFNGFIDNVINSTVQASLGAIQIHHTKYLSADTDRIKYDMPWNKDLLARIHAVSGVINITPRIMFEGLLTHGAQSSVFMATAIDPDTEYTVCPKRKDIENQPSLTNQNQQAIFLGDELAQGIGANLQDTIVLQATTQTSNINALDASVQGTLSLNVPFQAKRMLVTSLRFAQNLLRMPGRVTEYAIQINDLKNAKTIAQAISRSLGHEYEVLTWEERDLMVKQFVTRLKIIFGFINVILFVLITAGIINTMLMAVYERTKEIGTMIAIGTKRWQIMALFLIESATLGCIAACLGAFFGTLIITHLSHTGVFLKPPGTKMVQIFPHIGIFDIFTVIIIALIGAVFSALYPAYKASKLKPVDALRAH